MLSIFLVPTHTKTTLPSRSKRKHKVIAREISSEANHKEIQGFVSRSSDSPSESYVSVEELVGLESLATRSLELSLFQPLLLSTILILSTKGARSRLHRLAAAHDTIGS